MDRENLLELSPCSEVDSRPIHLPVLPAKTIEALQPITGGRYIDATLGGGGHAEEVLRLSSPHGALLGIDVDPAALSAARARLAHFGDRVVTAESYFDRLGFVAREAGFDPVDGILFDLGVSSLQIDTPARGFSFQDAGPLDMRLGPSAEHTAADLVNELSAAELQTIFREFGEERFARRIAGRIVTERRRHAITTTEDLARIVAAAVAGRGPRSRIHPATRVFQALRIAVNDELTRIATALPQAADLLRVGGRLVVISFHSLEDRLVKRFIRDEARGCVCPPEVPVCVCGHTPRLRPLTARPIRASSTEIASNPRSRSARLRVAQRIAAAPPPRGD
jgi:16S rRNA (cytosine1402-N4)-methyltransferase